MDQKTNENRVISVIKDLLEAVDVPASTLASLNGICQFYKFDRARSFIRIVGTNSFVPLDDVNYGQEPKVYARENGIDFEKSHYHGVKAKAKANTQAARDHEIAINLIDEISTKNFIHTRKFSEYEHQLTKIGYIPNEGKKVSEACISCVSGIKVGMMGYFVFEKFEHTEPLTLEEKEQVYYLCEIIENRIENFETGKQLRDEEMQNVTDVLTGITAFPHFRQEVQSFIKQENSYVFLSFDIDKFKFINHNWGFEVGNDILIHVANILKDFIATDECCCRMGDDKFALFIRYNNQEDLQKSWDYLDHKFYEMQKTDFPEIKITIICGAYILGDETDLSFIIDRANIARRSVKGAYKNTLKMYNHKLHIQTEVEKTFEKQMMAALYNGEFIPYLQPKFCLKTNQICGAEALARWQTKNRLIAPIEFIPLFEKNGFIVKLDFLIYEQVFQFIRSSLDKGYDLKPISLNVSREHIKNSKFLDELLQLIDQYQVPHHLIELEITESIFSHNERKLEKFVKNIRSHNIMVSIDDFGAAYSSLNLLKDIEVDAIKMDKKFIDNLTNDYESVTLQKDKIIIKNIINMLNDLNFKTIFEGIETIEHAEFLKQCGCYVGQGYVFAKPMPLLEFEEKYFK